MSGDGRGGPEGGAWCTRGTSVARGSVVSSVVRGVCLLHAVSVLLMSLSLFALVRALAPLAEEAQPSRPSAPCSLMEGDRHE